MKRTLESLVVALTLSVPGCATTVPNRSISTPVSGQITDGKYDSLDNYVNVADIQALKDANYMVVSESKYKGPDGKEIVFHSLGTAVLYKDIGQKTYLVTANHVVQNDDVVLDFLGREYHKISESFYLLEDNQVERFQSLLRKSSQSSPTKERLYLHISSKRLQRTSKEIEVVLNVIKPRVVTTNAYHEAKDIAIISVSTLSHKPLAYTIGDGRELQTQNILYVTGWPLGLVKTVTQGHVTSVNDSPLGNDSPETNFIFDASISPGNSGGGIFAVRDGKFELVGLTDASYPGNDLYVGVKINPIQEIFNGNSIRCSLGWKCNLSSPYELKLDLTK